MKLVNGVSIVNVVLFVGFGWFNVVDVICVSEIFSYDGIFVFMV